MSQEQLISCGARRIRCVAGPGTGKTWAIRERVRCLLNNGQVNASKIFACTFTRQAAAQLKRDLCGLDTEGAEEIVASTLHSFAFSLLSHEQAIRSLGRTPRPCFESELVPLTHDLADEFDGVRNVKKKLEAFDAMWARLQHEEAGWPESLEDREFNNKYLEWMRFHGGMTVGELISLAVQFLRNNPVNYAQNLFEHIIVDEYQDLNKADQTLIDLISKRTNIAIVGDDDQAIYAFRCAHPEGIREWYDIQSYPKEDIELRVCRRCDGRILSLANSLISYNPNRLRNDLQPMKGRESDGDIHLIQWETRQRETDGTAQAINKLLKSGAVPENESILVLVPRRAFGQFLLEKLTDLGIENVQLNTSLDWEDQELGKRIALLTLLENPDDLIALRFWLGIGHNSWRKSEYSRLYEYCNTNGIRPPEILRDANLCRQLRLAGLRNRWCVLQEKLSELCNLTQDELIDELLPVDGVTEKIGKSIRELKRGNPAESSIKKLLTDAFLARSEDNCESKVNILTYWGAKGATSHTVIITSLVNGILPKNPNPNINERAILEEERRLMFVAVTRAKHRLIMSSFRKVNKGENRSLGLGLTGNGQWLPTQASRFLTEMGPNLPTAQSGDDWLNSFSQNIDFLY